MRNLFAVLLLCIAVTISAASFQNSKGRISLEPTLKTLPYAFLEGTEDAPADLTLELVLFVKQQNLDKLEKLLLDVSSPHSKNYGRHQSMEEVNALVAPSDAALNALHNWFEDNKISTDQIEASPSKDIITLKIPVRTAETLLNADFRQFVHRDTEQVVVRTLEYSVPASVAPFIDFIGPTTRFPTDIAPVVKSVASRTMMKTKRKHHNRRKNKRRGLSGKTKKRKQTYPVHPFFDEYPTDLMRYAPDECAEDMCPLRKLRSISDTFEHFSLKDTKPSLDATEYWAKKNESQEWELPTMNVTLLRNIYGLNSAQAISSNSSVGVTGFLDQFVSMADLRGFYDLYEPHGVNRTISIYGHNVESNPGGEGNLDIQYASILSPGVQSTVYWSTLGRQPDNVENEPFLSFLFNVSSTPVVPTVFSISYGDNEHTVSMAYQARVDVEFQKAGLRGISMLVASGDGGVAGGRPDPCTEFVPTYPAASPWVTTVGGTTSMEPEIAAGLSSGGFSNRYSIPPWQVDAVNEYKAKAGITLPDPSLYNNTGAGFPDISASALRFPVVLSGEVVVVDGTSCSAPVVAAIVALLNDVRAHKNKGPLGFLNPLIYSNSTLFNDITDGSNPGCGEMGFTAIPGWDPVTGMGTPNFPRLMELVMRLP